MYNKDIYPALQTFGIEHLRDEQERALTPILAGRDVLVRLRTGGGKSLLYHLPALLDEPGSLTLVFSPLRALQRDQVQALERRGVHAALLNSDLSTSMHADILRDFAVNGGLLYLAQSSSAVRTCAPHLPPRMCAAWSLTRRISCRRSSTAFEIGRAHV